MKHLDLFSRRIFVAAVSFGLILLAASLFLFSLATVSKSFAKPLTQTSYSGAPIVVDGYTIIGAINIGNGKAAAVGFRKNIASGEIKLFPN